MNVVYKCPDGHETVVKCPENIVIPMLIDCQSCRLVATFHPNVQVNAVATHEWYKPVKRKGLTQEDNKRYKKHGVYLKQL